jgi:hypothetical protein
MANSTGLKRGGATGAAITQYKVPVIKAVVDIADAVADGLTTGGYVAVQTIPAGTRLKIWGVRNATALSLGSGPEIELGDGDDDDLFMATISSETAGVDHALTGDSAISSTAKTEKTYTAAGELRLKVTGGTIASGKVQITYSLIDLNNNLPSTVDF